MKTTAAMFERSRNILFFQWEELLRLRLVVLKSCEHEDIHDLRVASRRFRAVLNLLSPLCRPKDVKLLSRQVRRLTRSLGNLRNLDEALHFFGSHSLEAGLPDFISRLSARRGNEQQRVIEALKDFKPRKLDLLVREMVAGISVAAAAKAGIPPLPAYFSDCSIALFETIQSFLPEALSFENSIQRHAMRIGIKKWRYFLESVSRIAERDHGEVLERLKRYQSLLGSMNDMTVFLEMCRDSGVPAGERDAIEAIIATETRRLYDEFIAFVESEPLGYSFLI